MKYISLCVTFDNTKKIVKNVEYSGQISTLLKILRNSNLDIAITIFYKFDWCFFYKFINTIFVMLFFVGNISYYVT